MTVLDSIVFPFSDTSTKQLTLAGRAVLARAPPFLPTTQTATRLGFAQKAVFGPNIKAVHENSYSRFSSIVVFAQHLAVRRCRFPAFVPRLDVIAFHFIQLKL